LPFYEDEELDEELLNIEDDEIRRLQDDDTASENEDSASEASCMFPEQDVFTNQRRCTVHSIKRLNKEQ
jgi:hypothetical protein